MAFVALQPMTVASAQGGQREVAAGDLVPEAASWTSRNIWIKRGWIAYVADADAAAFVQALKTPGGNAGQYAPLTPAHFLAGASRRLQHGTGPQAPTPLAAESPVPSALEEEAAKPAPAPKYSYGKKQKEG